jgi:hypothetical protein
MKNILSIMSDDNGDRKYMSEIIDVINEGICYVENY